MRSLTQRRHRIALTLGQPPASWRGQGTAQNGRLPETISANTNPVARKAVERIGESRRLVPLEGDMANPRKAAADRVTNRRRRESDEDQPAADAVADRVSRA
jgi:hypothetical protein